MANFNEKRHISHRVVLLMDILSMELAFELEIFRLGRNRFENGWKNNPIKLKKGCGL